MQNYMQDPFNKALAAGHAALDLTAEPQDQAALDSAEAACQLAQSNKVAYAFTGASNHEIDTIMTLKTAQPVDGHVPILLQSKQSASTGTTTLNYALEEMGKDLENSGICVLAGSRGSRRAASLHTGRLYRRLVTARVCLYGLTGTASYLRLYTIFFSDSKF